MKIQMAAIIIFLVPVHAQASDSPLTRFAQKWASVLVHGKSALLSSQQKDESKTDQHGIRQSEEPIERPTERHPDQPTDPQVKQQVNAIQTRLDQEHAKLEARIQQLGKQREAALNKHDTKQLKQIEALEQQVIQAYETQIQKIINSAKLQGAAPPNVDQSANNQRSASNQARQVHQVHRVNPAGQQASSSKEAKRNQPAPKKNKWFRLFPPH